MLEVDKHIIYMSKLYQSLHQHVCFLKTYTKLIWSKECGGRSDGFGRIILVISKCYDFLLLAVENKSNHQ